MKHNFQCPIKIFRYIIEKIEQSQIFTFLGFQMISLLFGGRLLYRSPCRALLKKRRLYF